MGVYFGWAIVIVMSCRVYLNLCEAVHDRRITTLGSTAIETADGVTNPSSATRQTRSHPRAVNTIDTLEHGRPPPQNIELKSQPSPTVYTSKETSTWNS